MENEKHYNKQSQVKNNNDVFEKHPFRDGLFV